MLFLDYSLPFSCLSWSQSLFACRSFSFLFLAWNLDVFDGCLFDIASRFHARKRKEQKSYGKQKGFGSRKGKKTARLKPKRAWMNKIRLQRRFIKSLRDKDAITSAVYHELYMKSKGGFFRSLRHLKLHASEKGIVKNE